MPTGNRPARAGIFGASVALAYALGGFQQFFFLAPSFCSDAVMALVVMATIAAVRGVFNSPGRWRAWARSDGGLAAGAAGILIFNSRSGAGRRWRSRVRPGWTPFPRCDLFGRSFARVDVGLLFRPAGGMGSWWASALLHHRPNWQLFWLADALDRQKHLSVGLRRQAFVYVVGYRVRRWRLPRRCFEERNSVKPMQNEKFKIKKRTGSGHPVLHFGVFLIFNF